MTPQKRKGKKGENAYRRKRKTQTYPPDPLSRKGDTCGGVGKKKRGGRQLFLGITSIKNEELGWGEK